MSSGWKMDAIIRKLSFRCAMRLGWILNRRRFEVMPASVGI